MRNERKNLRFVPQKLRKSFANGNPKHYARLSTFNELVELSGPYFITQSLGFDGAVVSVFDS